MATSIVNASAKDIDTIRDLAEKIWWPSYGPILAKNQIVYMLGTIYSRESILKVINEGSQSFILFLEDDQPKGFASYGSWPERADTWKIHKLYMLPECQGRGFGRRLIEEISSRAKHNGITTLVLNVNRHNPAYHFYLKHGFSVLREEDIPIGPYWMNDYLLSKPLN